MYTECEAEKHERIQRNLARIEELARTPRINLELLDEVWRKIEDAAITQAVIEDVTLQELQGRNGIDGWNQGHWRGVTFDQEGEVCGTALCFAGWTVQLDAIKRGDLTGGWLLSDKRLIQLNRDELEFTEYEDDLLARDDDDQAYIRPNFNGQRLISAKHRARRLLGLDAAEKEQLFAAENTFEMMTRIVTRLRHEELMRRARQARWLETQAADPAPVAAPATDEAVEQ
jgi:hypothetical protein